MYSYVARQPIFNRQQKTAGYELLFRDGESNAFPDIEENNATCRLLVENFLSGHSSLAALGQRCFINFPQKSLLRLQPLMLPKKQVVIEVLESCEPNDQLLEAIRQLSQQGYLIALDDFDLDPRWQRFFPYVHILKLDLMKIGVEAACAYLADHRHHKLMFLAEKVETHEEFMQTYEAGFHFFQGYYFSRPELVKQRLIKPERMVTLRLLQEVCRPQIDVDRVEQIVASDVSLSYLLLRFVNTAERRTTVPINGFRQALIYLGEERLKVFVSVVATARAARHKPSELYALSLQRAKMCELLAAEGEGPIDSRIAFMTGLLSLLDGLLDQPLATLLQQLPLEAAVTTALLARQGELGILLELVTAYERADWDSVRHASQTLALSAERIGDSYQLAVSWAESYLAALPG